MIPVAVSTAVVLVFVTGAAVVWRQPPGERRTLTVTVLVALAVRVAVTVALDASGAWHITGRGATTPDEASVDLAARLLAGGHDATPLELGGSLHTSWLLVSWAFYDLVWNDLLVMKLLSAAFGALLVVPTYLLARRLHSERAAILAGWGLALFPPALVWSALALRESMLALVLTTTVLLAVVRPTTRASTAAWIAGATTCLVVLSFTRSYMTPVLMGILVLAALLRGPMRTAPQRLATAGAACALAVAVLWVLPTGQQLVRTTANLATAETVYNPLSDCERDVDCRPKPAAPPPTLSDDDRRSRADGEAPDADPPPDAEPPLEDSLQSITRKGLLRGVAIAVLAGRPTAETAEFFLLLQPGVVVWWTMLPAVCVGAAVLTWRRELTGLLATAGYAAAVLLFLAYSGQFIRHHFMLEPVAVALAAIGVVGLRSGAGPRGLRWGAAAATAIMAVAALASVAHSLLR